MTKSFRARTAGLLAAVSALATVIDATSALAQQDRGAYPNNGYPNNGYPNNGYPNNGYPSNGYPNNGYPPDRSQIPNRGDQGPPPGQYAPPPQGYDRPDAYYDDRTQRYDREYAQRYSRWAEQYCTNQRNDNTAAGAVIGGVLGAVIGSGMAGRHDRGAGAVVGGALGAGTGAAIGASSSSGAPGGCPPGYYLRGGAPTFVYGGPAYAVYAAPGWYNPWLWYGGRWVYRPYRSWYWAHREYWRPGWHGGYRH